MFLMNTLFRRGDIGAMIGSDISMLHMALHANSLMSLNLGGLLVTHFCCERSNPAGDICCGGLITKIAYGLTILRLPTFAMSPAPLLWIELYDWFHFLGVYAPNLMLRAYQFTFEPNDPTQQKVLPFYQDFDLQGRNRWVLNKEELHNIRVMVE
jgi:hypothetical protein